MKKKGVSPVIATILLVSITLVLAVIIFFWARTFIGDNIEKQGRAVEFSCEDVDFKVDAFDGTIQIENIGGVPLNGVEIRKKAFIGEITQVETVGSGSAPGTLESGQTTSFTMDPSIENGDEIIVVPILLGETSSERKSHICDEDYGKEILVGG